MIKALSVAVPEYIESCEGVRGSDDFARVTGVKKTRRWGGTATELAIQAVRHMEFNPHLIDAVIVVTQSPDRFSPCMAIDIMKRFGINQKAAAFDVNQSCTGFIYGLSLCQLYDTTLLVCVDMLRLKTGTIEDWIFSDAASACIVEGGNGYPARFFNSPHPEHLYFKCNGDIHMDGGAVFDFVTKNVPDLIKSYDEDYEGFTRLVQHQPNLSMMRIIESRTGFVSRSLRSIGEYGNQSMVSIPTAIAMNEKDILGMRLLLCGYGAGFSVAITGTQWAHEPISKIVEV